MIDLIVLSQELQKSMGHELAAINCTHPKAITTRQMEGRLNHLRKRLSILGILTALVSIFITNCSRADNNEIRIGAVLSLTGSAAQYGQWSKQGIEIAVEEANNKGGIAGAKVRVIYEDDLTDPKAAVAAANKLVSIDRVICIIGPLTSSNVLAVAPVIERLRVVLISPCASNPSISQAGEYIFRNWPSDDYEGKAMADFLFKVKDVRSVAVLAMNNEYGIGIRDVFLKKAAEDGISVLVNDVFEQDSSDFRTQLIKISGKPVEAIYMPGHAREVAKIIKQAKELGIKAIFASSVAFGSPEIFDIAGDAVEGVYFTAPSFILSEKKVEDSYFYTRYVDKFKQVPEVFAAHAYDATQIIISAISNAGTGTQPIKAYLENLKDFPGVTGLTSFDKNGDVIKPVSIKVVTGRAFKVVQ